MHICADINRKIINLHTLALDIEYNGMDTTCRVAFIISTNLRLELGGSRLHNDLCQHRLAYPSK